MSLSQHSHCGWLKTLRTQGTFYMAYILQFVLIIITLKKQLMKMKRWWLYLILLLECFEKSESSSVCFKFFRLIFLSGLRVNWNNEIIFRVALCKKANIVWAGAGTVIVGIIMKITVIVGTGRRGTVGGGDRLPARGRVSTNWIWELAENFPNLREIWLARHLSLSVEFNFFLLRITYHLQINHDVA